MSIAGGKQSKTTPAPSGCRHLQGFSGEAEDPWTFEVFWVGRDIPGGCEAVQGCSHPAPEGKSHGEGRGSSVLTLLCLEDISISSLPFSKESPLGLPTAPSPASPVEVSVLTSASKIDL